MVKKVSPKPPAESPSSGVKNSSINRPVSADIGPKPGKGHEHVPFDKEEWESKTIEKIFSATSSVSYVMTPIET